MTAWIVPEGAHTWLPSKGETRLTAPLDFGADVVPEGFHTDGASTPWIVWALMPPWGDGYRLAAILHDYHYRRQHVTRAQADTLFLYFMVVYEVPAWKRGVMWAALRLAGWRAWRRNAGALAAGHDWMVPIVK